MDATTIDKLSENGIDYLGGVERFGGNSAMFEKFVRRFPNDPHFDELQGHIKAQDADQAFRCAHTLKGVVGNLSFTDYFEAVSNLSDVLSENKMEEACTAMSSVKEAHDKVISALEEV